MKETDPRVKDFTDEYFKCYKLKYKISPAWSAKEGEHVKRMWKRCDLNKIVELEVYSCFHWYMESEDKFIVEVKHDAVHFCNKFEKHYLAYKDTQLKKVFAPKPQGRIDEALKETVITDQYVIDTIRERYKTPQDLIKTLRFLLSSPGVREKKGRVYGHWVKWWNIGGQIWGKDVMKDLWKDTEKDHAEKIRQQAKDLLKSAADL